MSKLYYNYHKTTGEYLAPAQQADESPEEPGVFHKPAFSTFKEPPTVGQNKAAVYKDSAWTTLPDYRGKTIYSKTNGQPLQINLLGLGPNLEEQTFDPMPDQTHSWDKVADRWVVDTDKVNGIFESIRRQTYNVIEEFHTASLIRMYGNYSFTERTTWTLKLSIANSIQSGQELDEVAISFLNASGQNTDEKKNAWAALVLLRNSQYAYAVGVTERHRKEARTIAREATNATFLKSDLDKFFLECNKEIDSFLS